MSPSDRTRPARGEVPGPGETQEEALGTIPGVLGPCRLLGKLGGGATGSVHLAEMIEERPWASQGDRVVVKVLAPQLVDDVIAFGRFRREAELGALLQHPSLVRTHASESCEADGKRWHFLIMEWGEGQTFRDLMEQMQVVPEALLRDLGLQVARALGAVHAAGAIHRDVKPENALLLPGHAVKLADFGSARLLDSASRLSQQGQFIGSPLYAAPEQFQDGDLSPSTDLYALGVLLYEAATGTQPFAAEGLRAVMRRHLGHRPLPARKLNARLSPLFEEVLECLLEKDPELRFRSAEALAEVLEHGETSEWWREREDAALSAGRSRPGARPWQPRETSLVGREAELQVLQDLLEDARAGRGRLLLLEGELGVGKSRLIEEFLRRIEQSAEDVHVLYGANSPTLAGDGLGAVAAGVVAFFGGTLLEKRLRPYLDVTPGLVPSFAALLKGEPTPARAERVSQEALHALTCNLASGLAQSEPVVWVMEDLHFAGAGMRGLLGSLARTIGNKRILLIVTARSEQSRPEDQVELERLELTRRLRLERLDKTHLSQLVAEALSSDLLAEQLAGTLLAKTGGNPFFVLQVLRELKDTGILRQLPDSSWIARRDVDTAAVPGSILSLMLGRLEALSEDDRHLLDVAAVGGIDFDADLISRVLGRERLAVLQSLARLEREHALVRAAGAGFVFDNPLLREGLLEELPQLLAAEYHSRMAHLLLEREGLEGAPAEHVPGDLAVTVAEHALAARDLPVGRPLFERALEHLAAGYAHDKLLSLAARLRAVLREEDAALRCSVHLHEAACLVMTGRFPEAHQAIENAIAAGTSAGDESSVLRARQTQGRLLASLGNHLAAREVLESVVEGAVATGDPAIEARATKDLGAVLSLAGQHVQARTYLERSLEVARETGDTRTEAASTSNLGSCYTAQGLLDRANELYRLSLELCRSHGHRDLEAIALINLGAIHLDLGDNDRARDWLEQSLELARSLGRRSSESIALVNLGHLNLEEGRLDEAEQLLTRGAELFVALGARQNEGYALLRSGDLERARDHTAQAKSLYEQALETLRAVGSAAGVAEASLGLGRCLAEREEFEAAVPLLETAEQLTADLVLGDNGALPSAWLALLGRRDPAAVVVGESSPVPVRAEAHAVLHRAGGGPGHAEAARKLLEKMASHLPEDERERFWSLNPTARYVNANAQTES